MDAKSWLQNHWDELLADLQALINIPSVSHEGGPAHAPFGENCARVLKEALGMGERMGFKTHDHDGYCGTLLWPGEMEEEIGIFAHLDVVPEGNGWSWPPYKATVLEDMVIGRGSSDNKGPALAALYALKYLMDQGYKPRHSFRFFFGVNEECGMKDIEYYVSKMPMPVFSFTPDARFPVCHGEKGLLEIDAAFELPVGTLRAFSSGVASNAVPALAHAELAIEKAILAEAIGSDDRIELSEVDGGSVVTAHGIAAHAAFPEGSLSAEVVLAQALLRTGLLDETAEHLMRAVVDVFSDYNGAGLSIAYEDEISGKLTHVGGMANYTDGMIVQNINIRYPITANREIMRQAVKDRLDSLGFRIIRLRDSAPSLVDKEALTVRTLTDISNRYLRMDEKPFVMGGGTYARKLSNAVAFGPGIPGDESAFGPTRGQGHQPDEYIKFSTLEQAFLIYAEALSVLDQIV